MKTIAYLLAIMVATYILTIAVCSCEKATGTNLADNDLAYTPHDDLCLSNDEHPGPCSCLAGESNKAVDVLKKLMRDN